MKEKLNTKQGISLIVLVITIIVIIILAVAVILTLANNNPIGNAKFAVEKNDEAVRKETAILAYADWYTKKNLGTLEEEYKDKSAQDYVKDALKSQGIDSAGLIVLNNGTIVTNAPTIPNGFEYLEGTIDTGFVIKNTTDDNEFVWVPVEKGSFKREGFGIDISDYSEPYTNNGAITESEEITEYNTMLASVEKYGGFYIGRYEASLSDDGKAQSIGNVTPYFYIPWGDSMTNPGENDAVGKARAVYPDSNEKTTGDAVSTLPYGVQWDATVRFILTNYPEDILTDSQDYGNYADPETREGNMINTGNPEFPKYMLNNIYDIAGNVAEWTMEARSSNNRVYRGSSYNPDDGVNTVSNRCDHSPDGDRDYIGFRLALYIK